MGSRFEYISYDGGISLDKHHELQRNQKININMPSEQGCFSQPKMGETEFLNQMKKMSDSVDASMDSGATEKTLSPVKKIKQLRQDGDAIIQRVKELPPSRELSLVVTKLQEGVMWLGMELKKMNEPNPYPSSKDPNTGDVIEPTADGLKL